MIGTILIGNALYKLRELETESVHCIVTSPPYFGLRDYGMSDQIGMEETPEQFIQTLVDVFRECKRVLKNDGTLWVNMGDSYANNGTGGNGATGGRDKSTLQSKMPPIGTTPVKKKVPKGLKAKDLIGIPWMLAFALRSDGWYLRQDIIWSKPNPMPESVTDRCTKSHEYIFMLSKSQKYHYNHIAIRTEAKESTVARLSQDVEGQKGSDRVPGKTNGSMKAVMRKADKQRGHSRRHAGFNERWDNMSMEEQQSMGANKRSVWEVATRPFKEAHFATFPPELIVDCIKAGCPDEGIVLDPFFGAGTTGIVSNKLGRNFIGIELNPYYAQDIAAPRLKNECGMFLSLTIETT